LIVKSQSGEGINFQGIARNSNGALISNANIMIRLSIVDSSNNGNIIYQEIKSVSTNALGVFSLVIGSDEPNKIITIKGFDAINWSNTNMYIKVEIDQTNALFFQIVGFQKLNFIPYAYYAKKVDSNGIIGIIPVQKGGTGTNNLMDLKKALSIEKQNNTADAEKPISILQQAAIDLKLSISDTSKMLENYLKKSEYSTVKDTIINNFTFDTVSLSKRIDDKPSILFVKNYADSVSNLAKIDTSSISQRIDDKPSTQSVKNYADSVSNLAKIDTTSLSNRIDDKPSTLFVKNYADSVSNLAKIDTSSLSNRIDDKPSTLFVKNYTDSVSNLAKIDTSSLSNRIDDKPSTLFVKNYADSVSNLAKIDTSSISQRIDLKASITSLNEKEDKINKSTNFYADSSSTTKYFAAKTVKNYIDSLHGVKITNSMLDGNIASSKLIGTDIESVGTILSGVWNANPISVEFGGTGNTALNGILLGNGTNSISTASYGYFYDTITQTAAFANTAYPIKIRKTDTELTNNILIENESRIKVLNSGKYNLQFSAQLDRASGTATCYVSIWLRKNGVDLANTATDITIQGGTAVAATVAAWNFFIQLNTNEYVELVWSTDNTTAQIQYSPTDVGKPRPAIPSMILSMQQIY